MSLATTLSDRMKEYENQTQTKLIKKLPVIIRLDGIGFSKFTRGFEKPFDDDLSDIMQSVSLRLAKEIQGVKFVYSQSDEISILLTDWDHSKENDGGRIDTWYDYRIQKIVSAVCAKATAIFNEELYEMIQTYDGYYIVAGINDLKNNRPEEESFRKRIATKQELLEKKLFKATFDARVFNLPLDEVTNYFIFRQQDALRNSISGFARKYYSHKQLQNVKNTDKIEMVKSEFGVDFNKDISQLQKVGFTVVTNNVDDNIDKFELDTNIPMFIDNRDYIERYL